MMTISKFNRRSGMKILAILPLSTLLFILMAMANGFFPERLHAGASKSTAEPGIITASDPLLLLNPHSDGDTIKKKTVVKIIQKENPGDTVVTETIEVIVSGDTTKTVKLIGHDGKTGIEHADGLIFISEDEDIEHVIGTRHDSVKVVKIIKHGEDFDVKHDEKYDVKHDTKKDVIIIQKSPGATWTASDEALSKTLVIIDGVKHTDKNAMAGLDPDQIKTIQVEKNKDIIKKYTDDKDCESVILITTK